MTQYLPRKDEVIHKMFPHHVKMRGMFLREVNDCRMWLARQFVEGQDYVVLAPGWVKDEYGEVAFSTYGFTEVSQAIMFKLAWG